MSYVLIGLNIAAHLAIIGLLVFLSFRTKSKGLILIIAVLLMAEISGLIFGQVVNSDWWRSGPGKVNDLELLLTIVLATPLMYRCLFLLGVFLIYREWRQGKFRYPPT